MKRAIPFICAALVAAMAISSSGCSGSHTSNKSRIEATTAEPTGDAGLTADEAERFFSQHVPDARFVHCSIIKGSYSVDFTLSDEKSEWTTNYDDFALSIKDACALFSKEYSVEPQIFDIMFFSDGDGGHIDWMSTDGGKTGVLTEQYFKNQKTEKTLSFDELVDYYGKQ